MTAELCKHDLDPVSCTDCKSGPRRARQTPDPSGFGPEFEARYPGRCSLDKSHEIEPGDMIRADGDGGYVCPLPHI